MKHFTDYKNHPIFEVNKTILWDINLTNLDYQKARDLVIERVVQYGHPNDYYAILNLYGEEAVKEEIKNIPFLRKEAMEFVSDEFSIPLSEMKCYERSKLNGVTFFF